MQGRADDRRSRGRCGDGHLDFQRGLERSGFARIEAQLRQEALRAIALQPQFEADPPAVANGGESVLDGSRKIEAGLVRRAVQAQEQRRTPLPAIDRFEFSGDVQRRKRMGPFSQRLDQRRARPQTIQKAQESLRIVGRQGELDEAERIASQVGQPAIGLEGGPRQTVHVELGDGQGLAVIEKIEIDGVGFERAGLHGTGFQGDVIARDRRDGLVRPDHHGYERAQGIEIDRAAFEPCRETPVSPPWKAVDRSGDRVAAEIEREIAKRLPLRCQIDPGREGGARQGADRRIDPARQPVGKARGLRRCDAEIAGEGKRGGQGQKPVGRDIRAARQFRRKIGEAPSTGFGLGGKGEIADRGVAERDDRQSQPDRSRDGGLGNIDEDRAKIG